MNTNDNAIIKYKQYIYVYTEIKKQKTKLKLNDRFNKIIGIVDTEKQLMPCIYVIWKYLLHFIS